MKLDEISVESVIQEAENLLSKEQSLSPTIKTTMKMMILVIKLLAGRINTNSKNSSKAPSEDKNRKRGSTKKKSDKNPGGQNGHVGTKLKKVSDPDRIEEIKIDRMTLPKGVTYKKIGYESRQKFDIEISRVLNEV
jgi:transposase